MVQHGTRTCSREAHHIEKNGKEIHTWVVSKQFVTIDVLLCFGIDFSIWFSLETIRLVDGEAVEL